MRLMQYPLIAIFTFCLDCSALAAKRLTVDDVRNMAFAKGVVTIKEIELDDGVWEVEGRDAGGQRSKSRSMPEAAKSSRSSASETSACAP